MNNLRSILSVVAIQLCEQMSCYMCDVMFTLGYSELAWEFVQISCVWLSPIVILNIMARHLHFGLVCPKDNKPEVLRFVQKNLYVSKLCFYGLNRSTILKKNPVMYTLLFNFTISTFHLLIPAISQIWHLRFLQCLSLHPALGYTFWAVKSWRDGQLSWSFYSFMWIIFHTIEAL